MSRATNLAEHILRRTGPVSTMKLQKLLYYAQAWHLTWNDQPLFSEEIQGWRDGPVVPVVHAAHRGRYRVETLDVVTDPLDAAADITLRTVIDRYGLLTGDELSALTHGEQPWIDSREGLAPGARGNRVISPESIRGYHSERYQKQHQDELEAVAEQLGSDPNYDEMRAEALSGSEESPAMTAEQVLAMLEHRRAG